MHSVDITAEPVTPGRKDGPVRLVVTVNERRYFSYRTAEEARALGATFVKASRGEMA